MGRSSLYATGLIFFVIMKGPNCFGQSFIEGYFNFRFFPSSQTWFPSFYCSLVPFQLWYHFISLAAISNAACASFHPSWIRLVLSFWMVPVSHSRYSGGLYPCTNLNGLVFVAECHLALWAYSAIGSNCSQSVWFVLQYAWRYCSNS